MPDKQDPVLRHKSGTAPVKSRKSRWHKWEGNHPLLLPNSSLGPQTPFPPPTYKQLAWVVAQPSVWCWKSPQVPVPAQVWEARVHSRSHSRSREDGGGFTSSFWISFVPSSRQVSPTCVHTQAAALPDRERAAVPEGDEQWYRPQLVDNTLSHKPLFTPFYNKY